MSDISREDALAHFGVKGMRWGVRKDGVAGVPSRTNREAKKDAEEYTRAKMFYGEGAGNRRKLINKSVEAKSKRDPAYKKAFDHHVNNTDYAKRASQARGERKRKDLKKSTGRTARGIKNLALGIAAPTTVTAAAAYYAWQNPQIRGVVKQNAGKAFSVAKGAAKRRETREMLKRAGLNIR